ncbi:MAG: hypothetical protein CVU17_10420 [Betaproteobacteria bacterium HGW-Betaproteobacteria-11]|nr:MAG: hypothetical protein CVU17_10420 [Betaproteobacteria bacterium HGW-Betaproteobacteria-11]
MFKRIVAAAAFSGALSGLLLTLVQQVQVIPLIHQAEVYEDAANEAAESVEHAHLHALATQDAEHEREHHYDADAWQPANGIERTLFTTGANIVIGLGFALLLSAVFAITGVKVDGRIGLLWGLAGYVIFFVAPSLSLPPEVPGTESARLVDRQVWWLITALCTTIGLSLLVFAKPWWFKLPGALLLSVPHFIGAPQPEVYGSAAPAELVHAFIYAGFLANAVFWLSLGALLGFFYKKLA